MKKREKQFEPCVFPNVVPAKKVLPMMFLVLLFGGFWLFLLAEDFKGNDIIFSWIGIRTGFLNIIFVVVSQSYWYLGRRIPYLYDFYRRSNRSPVRTIYESQILRLTYTLLSLEDQEALMEPVYSDWVEERNEIVGTGTKYQLFLLDAYYYGWFGWRIWRETRLREIKKKETIRYAALEQLPVFPKYDNYN